ncbi:MAG: ATP-binding protein [Actinomycetota bacterium]
MPTSRLHVAGDPALALIVRMFVGAVAERWNAPEQSRDDLRLAASELFSIAVEAGKGPVTFELSSAETGLELRAGDVHLGGADGEHEGWSGVELIRALFPDAEIGDTVRIRIPAPA